MIEIDAQFSDLKRFGEQAAAMGARGTRFAINDVLNDLAFGAMRYYPKYLGRRLTVRNRSFMYGKKRFGVARSRPRELRAYTFSRRMSNFSGWTEQQRGGDKRERFGTLRSRGKNRSKQMRRKARLKAGKIPNIADLSGASTNAQLAKMLVGLRMAGTRGPFIAGGVGRMPWGLWTMGNLARTDPTHPEYRSLHLLQRFDPPADTKRIDWAGGGAAEYIARADLKSTWNAAYARSWAKAKK